MSDLLSEMAGPADLKGLRIAELSMLAEEIRTRIKDVVLRHGGHLASNLGVVELTIALHYTFDFLRDRLVWDVGHQCYAHKLLTGRAPRFGTLRQRHGLTGFPSKDESPYDPFVSGHSGTSISTALGLLCGDEIVGQKRKVVAVIGDGAISSGMPFEALNHAGDLSKSLIVVLNDNSMSISGTVGALSKHLSKIRVTSLYNELKREVHHLLNRVPVLGARMERALEVVKEAVRNSMVPGRLFEELGFRYFGPVDGHDVRELIAILGRVKELEEPVLLHVVTEKGRGHGPAVADPARYHSASPELVEDGKLPGCESAGRGHTYTKVFSQAVLRLAEQDPRIVAITAAMPDGTGLAAFAERFPERFFDVGICEAHAIGLAGGLSTADARPVAAVYSTFLQRAVDQIFHDLCLQRARALLVIDRAGIVGADGPTHHGAFDIAMLRHLPGMVLMAPKDGPELERMLVAALEYEAVVAIRYPRDAAPTFPEGIGDDEIALGRAELLREGRDALIVAYGAMVFPAFEAAGLLAEQGVEAGVINARFARPLDEETIRAQSRDLPLLVTVEDHALAGGFGSAVLELLTAQGHSGPRVMRLGLPDRFVEHGPRGALLAELGLDAEGIAKSVLAGLEGAAS